jgi:hypothetical protein
MIDRDYEQETLKFGFFYIYLVEIVSSRKVIKPKRKVDHELNFTANFLIMYGRIKIRK